MNFSVKKALLTEKIDDLFQNSKKVVFGMMAGAALLFATTSCEKNPDSGNFDQSTSAGALANLSCTDTVSIPVDANGISAGLTLVSGSLPTTTGTVQHVSTNPANDYLQLGFGDELSFFTCSNAAGFNVEDLIPSTSSPAYGNASTYKGAFQPGVTPWTNGWTNFNPGFCCN